MKTLMRVGAVLAAVAFCAPALACSDMWQQTTAQTTTTEQQPVAAAQPAQAEQVKQARQVKKTAKAQTKVAKARSQKVAAAN